MKQLICQFCDKEFLTKKVCKSRVPKFCSRECYAESLKMHINCQECGAEIVNKHSVSIKNRIYCSPECRVKATTGVQLSEDWKHSLSEGRKNSEKCKGENLYNWKGGKETEHERMILSRQKRRSAQKIAIDKIFLGCLLKAQQNKCFYCDCELAEYKAIEHLTPLSKGGDNQRFNLMYSCKSCNSKKKDKTMEEYAIHTGNIQWFNKFDFIYSTALLYAEPN